MLHYTVKKAIAEAVGSSADDFFGKVLDVGCGSMPYREVILANERIVEYVGMDIESSVDYGVKCDIVWDGSRIPVQNEAFDCVLTTEFLEHHAEPAAVLKEMHRVMTKGGFFFATVPFIWNLHELPHDEFRYTPFSLQRMMEQAGFRDIKIKALGGWNYSLAQMIGLWITFAPLPRYQRGILRRILFPFYTWLIRTDVKPEAFDGGENSMYSALSISALK